MTERPVAPVKEVQRRLALRLQPETVALVPRDYVKLGDVLILDLPAALQDVESEVGEAFAEVLHARSVLARTGTIQGEFRQPKVRHVWGDPNTETTHVENGVRFRMDPAKVMFSPGNLPERQRVARLPVDGETVVDLFAGIGYFSLPLAVHGTPRAIVAIEKNPDAYSFLETNIEINDVGGVIEARLGDNRDVAPIGVADRVLMGYLPDPTPFLPTALSCLKPSGGSLHYHTVVDVPSFPADAFRKLQELLSSLHWRATLKQSVSVKSFGPGAVHGVLDVEVQARAS